MQDNKILTIIGASCVGFLSGATALYLHSKHKEIDRSIRDAAHDTLIRASEVEDNADRKMKDLHEDAQNLVKEAHTSINSLHTRIEELEQEVESEIKDWKQEASHSIGHSFTATEKISEKIDKVEEAVYKRIGELDRKLEISHTIEKAHPIKLGDVTSEAK